MQPQLSGLSVIFYLLWWLFSICIQCRVDGVPVDLSVWQFFVGFVEQSHSHLQWLIFRFRFRAHFNSDGFLYSNVPNTLPRMAWISTFQRWNQRFWLLFDFIVRNLFSTLLCNHLFRPAIYLCDLKDNLLSYTNKQTNSFNTGGRRKQILYVSRPHGWPFTWMTPL